MRSIFKFILVLGACYYVTGCDKADTLTSFSSGTPSVLSASTTTIAPQPADSNNLALTLHWTNPNYATDSNTVKYTIEFDSTGKNFSKAYSTVVNGKLSTTFTAKQLNNILLGFGYAFNVPVDMDVRVISSYANNNERLASNTIKIRITPYKVPPKVLPPTTNSLYLVGSATAGGWGNPVPVPAQKFTRLDSVTYQGTFYLNGGAEYLMLPDNGSWAHKYSVADNTIPGLNAGGNFGYDLSNNIPGPAKTGTYQITVDFQNGKFMVTQVKLYGLLYVPGDYQGWSPATAPTLGSPNNDGVYESYINVPAGGSNQFKFTAGPDWSTAYGDAGGGTISTSASANLSFPSAGFFQVKANTNTNTWSALLTTWSMIGDFNGWSGDVDMTYDAGAKAWKGTITVPSNGGFKFRANHDWGLNYGDNGANGSLEAGGDNIAITAGTHTVSLYLNNAAYYTYKIE